MLYAYHCATVNQPLKESEKHYIRHVQPDSGLVSYKSVQSPSLALSRASLCASPADNVGAGWPRFNIRQIHHT